MRRVLLLAACTLMLASRAAAQDYPTPASILQGPPLVAQAPQQSVPTTPVPAPVAARSMSEIAPTPEMWFYEQQRQEYRDPRNAVRAHAEYKAAQRRMRLASQQWFGYSQARPVRSVTPTTTTSSPHWGSNSHDPFIWSGVGRSTVVHDGRPYWR